MKKYFTETMTAAARGLMVLAMAFGVFVPAAIPVLAATAPTLTTTVVDGTNAIVTTAPIGSGVHATFAVVSNTSSTTPTGTADFTLYATTACSGNSTTQAGVPLVAGVATGATTTVSATGLSFKAHYNGDSENLASDGFCYGVVATAAAPTISTVLSSSSIVAGNSVHDSATLGGATADAGGVVYYTVFSDNACSSGGTSAGAKIVTAGVVPDSDSMLFSAAGTYYWQAVYSGNVNNGRATSTCQSEILTVAPTTTPVTTGHIIVDKVTNPSGNSTSFSFTTSGTGYASFNLTDAATPNNQTLNPGTYSIIENTVSGWTQTSAVCMKNNGTSTAYTSGGALTLAAGDTIACTFTNTKQGTTTSTGTISGQVFNDANDNMALDSGEVGLSGWTIKLMGTQKIRSWHAWYGFRWSSFANKGYTATTVTDATGHYSFGNLPAGIYFVQELKKSGWMPTTLPTGAVTLPDGASMTNINFGNIARAVTVPKPPKKVHDGNDADDDEGHRGSHGTSSPVVTGSTTTQTVSHGGNLPKDMEQNRGEIKKNVQKIFDQFKKVKKGKN